jgi:hypothetical protein
MPGIRDGIPPRQFQRRGERVKLKQKPRERFKRRLNISRREIVPESRLVVAQDNWLGVIAVKPHGGEADSAQPSSYLNSAAHLGEL